MRFLTHLSIAALLVFWFSSSTAKVDIIQKRMENATVTSRYEIPGFGIEETYGKVGQIGQLLHYRKKDVKSRPKRSSCEPSDDLKDKLRQIVSILKGILDNNEGRNRTTTERNLPALGNPCQGIADGSHECQKNKMSQILGILLELQAKDELAYLTPVYKETPRTKRSVARAKKAMSNCMKISAKFISKRENVTSCCGRKDCCKIHESGVPFDRSQGEHECCKRANDEIKPLKNLIVSICRNHPNGRCCPYFIKVGILTNASSPPYGIQFA